MLGDDAFGSIYEHYSGRPRPAERTNGNNTNSREPRQAQKRREDDDGHEHEDDGDWSVERDFEKATNVVKARRRLVVARDTAGNTTTAGLAALAAHAGATAADGADDRAPRSSSRSPTPSPSPSPLPSSSSPSEDKKKPSAKKRKKTGSSRTRRAASGVLINGKMVPLDQRRTGRVSARHGVAAAGQAAQAVRAVRQLPETCIAKRRAR